MPGDNNLTLEALQLAGQAQGSHAKDQALTWILTNWTKIRSSALIDKAINQLVHDRNLMDLPPRLQKLLVLRRYYLYDRMVNDLYYEFIRPQLPFKKPPRFKLERKVFKLWVKQQQQRKHSGSLYIVLGKFNDYEKKFGVKLFR